MSNRLHPDFPETPENTKESWDLPDPLADIVSALEAAGADQTLADIASVTDYAISSHEQQWKPGESIGSELDLNIVGTLTDGRWFSLDGWNDYTGWGCQDGATIYIGDTKEDVIANGLTEEARNHLGLQVSA